MTAFVIKREYQKITLRRLLLILLIVIIAAIPIGGNGLLIASAQLSSNFISNSIGSFLGVIFSGVASLTSAAAWLLEAGITFSLNTNNFRTDGVETAWKLLRDLANMIFIFVLVYIAFATILQISDFNTKRVLAILIIVALLLNFSFFLTGIVIDASNVLGGFLYSAITGNGTSNLATILEHNLQLTDIKLLSGQSIAGDYIVIYYLSGIIFLLIAFFVLLAGAILFVIRIVGLTFILILSPLAFAAAILPNTRKYWSIWLDKLINYSFLLPIYLGLTAVAVIVAGSMTAPDGNLVTAITNQTKPLVDFENYALIVLNFLVIAGLLIAALKISQDMAGGMGKLSGKWAGRATGLAAGAIGLTYRQTFGRGARAFRDSGRVTDMLESENRFMRRIGQFTQGTTDYMAKARGDVRAGVIGKTAGATAGAALGAGGIKVETGRPPKEGGFDARRARTIQQRTRRAEVEREAVIGRVREREERFGQALGRTPDEIKGRVEQQMDTYREQQAQDLEQRNFIERAFTTITGTRAANREAADVIRRKRKAPQIPQQPGLTTRDVQDAVKRAVGEGNTQ